MASTSVAAASSSSTKNTLQDAEVAFEDQQRINIFARKNVRLTDLKEEIDAKEKELQNLEDASGDIMLLDDDQCIPYPPHCCMSHVIWQSTTVLASYISLPELICVMLPNGWVVSHRHGSSLHHATKRLVLYLTERGERTNNLDPACCAFATPLPFYSLAIYHWLYVTTKYR